MGEGLRMVVFPLVMMVCWSNVVNSQQDVSGCTGPIEDLLVCLPYAQGKAPVPTATCCANILKVYTTDRKCLCELVGASFMGGIKGLPPFNQTLALSMSAVCNVNADPTECPGRRYT